MKKFEGMLLCTDLDGTLFKKDKTVSSENLEAIEYFKSEGGLFTFMTGRAPYYMKDVCDLVKPNAPVGCLNGGAVFDVAKNEYIWKKPIPTDVLEILKDVEKATEGVGIQIVTFDAIYFSRDNFVMERFRQLTGTPKRLAALDEVPTPLAKILLGAVNEKMDEVISMLHEHPRAGDFDFIRSEKSLYEIIPKGVSKGTLLVRIAEYLGIDMKNTVAIGDYNNDIEMVKAAGLGVAVGNAVDELKAVADKITVSNEDSAIARVIEEL